MATHDTGPDPQVSALPGFEGWTVSPAPAPYDRHLPPMLISPDGRAAIRQDFAEAMVAAELFARLTAELGGGDSTERD